MKLWDCFSTALRALRGNKLRSILTMLGILWGAGILSAVVDNIPFTAAMIPLIKEMGAKNAYEERQPKLSVTKSTLPEETKVLVLEYKG